MIVAHVFLYFRHRLCQIYMNLTPVKRRLIVIGIASLFIIYGFAGMIFKFHPDEKIINEIGFVLMAGAAIILFGGRNKGSAKNEKSEDPNDTDKKQLKK